MTDPKPLSAEEIERLHADVRAWPTRFLNNDNAARILATIAEQERTIAAKEREIERLGGIAAARLDAIAERDLEIEGLQTRLGVFQLVRNCEQFAVCDICKEAADVALSYAPPHGR